MNDKEKTPQAGEPSENYQIAQPERNTDTIHAELRKLLEKSKQESAEGKFYTHDEVRKRVREKFPFIK